MYHQKQLLAVGFIGQFMYSHVQELRELERNWDPSPKGLAKNDVVILYCTS